ncbi:MAG: glycosyltransferase family 39 protein [Anaerolineae bacterium]|nr:glycosyltransferase family 39 protein [Anaerolineae bacterium]
MDNATRKGWILGAAVAVLALGAGLRLANLNYHSLDLDESYSVWLSKKPLLELIRNTLNLSWDPHPPGYYVLLKGWTMLLGSGERSVRLLSALLGTATVGLIYMVGRRLYGPWTGLVAEGLSAANPLMVWVSQETRMYAAVAALGLASIYCLLRAVDDRRWGWWVGYVALALSAAYCHLFAALLLPVGALYLVVRSWKQRRLWLWGAIAVGIVALGYLPYARNAWEAGKVAPEINVYPRFDLPEQLYALAESFTLRAMPQQTPSWVWVPLLLVLLAIPVALWPRGKARARAGAPGSLLFAWLVLPVLAFLWINARRPAFNAKYLMPVVPAFWIAVAAGIVRVAGGRRWMVAPLVAPALVLAGMGWRYVWSTEALREDWRTGAQYVAQRATEQDQVFVHLHYARTPFEYYYRGAAPVAAPLGSRPSAPEDLDVLLQPYAGADVLWLVQSQEHNTDPQHVVEAWFAARGPVVTEQYPVGMSIVAFALRYRLDSLPAAAHAARIGYGSRLRLVGYALDQTRLRPDSHRLHPPSNWIHVTLYWQVDQPLVDAFETVVEMTDDQGGVWGGKLDQPRGTLAFYPPVQWTPGTLIRDDYDINLNPATPSGAYHIRVGVRGAADDAYWPVSGAATSDGRAILTDVQIERAGSR